MSEAPGPGTNGSAVCIPLCLTFLISCTFSSVGHAVAQWLRHAVVQWLRHCATNWKIAGSIPDSVIGIFQ
jgi:hypothetical protein